LGIEILVLLSRPKDCSQKDQSWMMEPLNRAFKKERCWFVCCWFLFVSIFVYCLDNVNRGVFIARCDVLVIVVSLILNEIRPLKMRFSRERLEKIMLPKHKKCGTTCVLNFLLPFKPPKVRYFPRLTFLSFSLSLSLSLSLQHHSITSSFAHLSQFLTPHCDVQYQNSWKFW
jgi:hypothetical protein